MTRRPAPGAAVPTESQSAAGSESQRAILERPAISIRARITAGFVVLFLSMAAITAAAVAFVSGVASKLQFLEKAGTYLFEIEQARRFEKNFFLYGTSLPDALASVHAAEAELERSGPGLRSVLGPHRYGTMSDDLAAYDHLLYRLSAVARNGAGAQGTDVNAIEAELRKVGARIVADAEEMVDKERLAMHAMLHTSMAVAVGFLVVMMLVMGTLAVVLSRAVVGPLSRFVAYAERIGAGDYSPIRPARRFRDEFSELAVAINRMLAELKTHQEQLLQAGKMAAVGTLTSGIAHELNNPLNNIGLTTEALIENFPDYSQDRVLEMLGQVNTQVERACATVRTLLDFTRKEQPVFAPVDVGAVLESTLALVGNELAIGQVELSRDVAPHLPKVRGNARHLQQLFLNLLLNAIQAMPDGGTLSLRASDDGQGGVRVDVADTGCGIPEENLDKIFDPFFTTKEPGRGTGLGLAVSFGIANDHGGRITVASQVGTGSTFTVWLPAGSASPRAAGTTMEV